MKKQCLTKNSIKRLAELFSLSDSDLVYGIRHVHTYHIDEKYLIRKIVRIEETPFEGYVYNLEVEYDDNFVAEGILVHDSYVGA